MVAGRVAGSISSVDFSFHIRWYFVIRCRAIIRRANKAIGVIVRAISFERAPKPRCKNFALKSIGTILISHAVFAILNILNALNP